jgi:hypothetical protein
VEARRKRQEVEEVQFQNARAAKREAAREKKMVDRREREAAR